MGPKGAWDEDSAFGADVKYRAGRFEMFYCGCGKDRRYRIGYAVSADGIHWHKAPRPVLASSPKGAWDWFKTSIPIPITAPDGTRLVFYSGHDGKDYVGVGRTKVVEHR